MPGYIRHHFPVTKFVQTNTIEQQRQKVFEEIGEVLQAIRTNESPERIDEEMTDVLHALGGYFQILEKHCGTEYVEELFDQIENKNRQRGYYDQEPTA